MVTSTSKLIREGSALVNFPKEVFYNPVQEFNRDLTISVINNYRRVQMKESDKCRTPGLRILEALSATGLRAIRFAKEIKDITKVVANDIDPVASALIKENVNANNVSDKVDVSCSDASLLMHLARSNNCKFNIIDLDPYGSATRFLDAAVQGITNGGLLCVTCTDAAVLCGSATGTSMGKYGAVAFGSKLDSNHEFGIRILLHAIQSSAGKYGLYIQPVLSLSIDFYFRVFVRIWDGLGVVKSISTKLGMLFLCQGCQTHHIQPLGGVENRNNGNIKVTLCRAPVIGPVCLECGGSFVIGGPFWIDPIHDVEFCKLMLDYLKQKEEDLSLATIKRIIGMVSLAIEELNDVPLYYEIGRLSKTVRSLTPSLIDIRSAILNAGYRVSSTHCLSNGIKTDASPSVIWNIMRSYLRQYNSGKIEKIVSSDDLSIYSKTILQKIDETPANFNNREDANPPSRFEKLLRFQPNPLPNWGPKPKAKKAVDE